MEKGAGLSINENDPKFIKRLGRLLYNIRTLVYILDIKETSDMFSITTGDIRKIENGAYVPKKVKDDYIIAFYKYGKEKGFKRYRTIFPNYFIRYVAMCKERRDEQMVLDQRDICEEYLECMHDLRKDLGYTQAAVARDTGYSVQTISKLENGKVPMGVAWRDILNYYMKCCSEEAIVKRQDVIRDMRIQINC